MSQITNPIYATVKPWTAMKFDQTLLEASDDVAQLERASISKLITQYNILLDTKFIDRSLRLAKSIYGSLSPHIAQHEGGMVGLAFILSSINGHDPLKDSIYTAPNIRLQLQLNLYLPEYYIGSATAPIFLDGSEQDEIMGSFTLAYRQDSTLHHFF